jgi:hypothetical protein
MAYFARDFQSGPLSSFRPPMAISRIVRLNQSPEDPAPHGLHLTEEAGRSA